MRLLLIILLMSTKVFAEDFKQPKCMNHAVKFWYDIYTKYDEDKGVVFEVKSLKILKVVDLPEDEEKRMRLVNKIKESYAKKNIKVKVQKGIKSMFNAGVERYLEHREMVAEKIKEMGLPKELEILPHVESGYNPKAMSKVGAIGMWQVMPGTARMYGFNPKRLKDPEYNTEAGLTVLLEKYQALKSWPLAITAYNHGLRGVQRAVEETQSRDICEIIEKYDGPHFGVASRNFYANFVTVLKILRERGLIDAGKNASK